MPEAEFEAYLAAMAKLLRLSPKQRDAIAGELRDHLESRLEELTAQDVTRDQAIRQALDEFGDAAVLSEDLASPRKRLQRRRLMQGSLVTAVLAAAAVLITTSLLPTRNPASAPPVVAGPATQPDDTARDTTQQRTTAITPRSMTSRAIPTAKPQASFVYISGQTRRPGAYTLPAKEPLSLPQLLASSGGLPEQANPVGLVVQVVRRMEEFPGSTATIRLSYPNARNATNLTLKAGDLIFIKPASATEKPDYEPKVLLVDMNTILPFLIQDPENVVFSDWWRQRQPELADHVGSVLAGLGYEDQIRSIDIWMGILTITGSPEAIAAADSYLKQMRQTLEERHQSDRQSQAAALKDIEQDIQRLQRIAGNLQQMNTELSHAGLSQDHPRIQQARKRLLQIRQEIADLHQRRADLLRQSMKTDSAPQKAQ